VDTFSTLLRDLKNCPKLTSGEKIHLWNAWKEQGDMNAREQLILCIMKWAIGRAKRWLLGNKSVGIEIISSLAIEGAIEGVEHWDPVRGGLTTCATFWIDQKIRGYLDSNRHVIKGPRGRNKLTAKTKELANKAKNLYSLSGDDSEYTSGSIDASSIEDRSEHHEDLVDRLEETARSQARVHDAYSQLDPRLHRILEERSKGYTLLEVGDMLSITRERVRQLELRAKEQVTKILEQPYVFKPERNKNMYETRSAGMDDGHELDIDNILLALTPEKITQAIAKVERDFAIAKKDYETKIKRLRGLSKALGVTIGPTRTRLAAVGADGGKGVRPGTNVHTILEYLHNHGVSHLSSVVSGTKLSKGGVSSVMYGNKHLFNNNGGNRWTLTEAGRKVLADLVKQAS
jgi:RNA polymerase sigma factor (sigma-70 family)